MKGKSRIKKERGNEVKLNLQLNRANWTLPQIRTDLLSGITVALALIPEAIAFSIIAGVDPMVGLYASFCIAVVIAFVGGRAGMISAATGAMALVMVDLVKDHGLQYLLAATILTGIIQVGLGLAKIGKFLTFIPNSVMTGFVNALAILIFLAQLPQFVGESWIMYGMVAVTLIMVYIIPRFTQAVPAPLIAILLMTVVAVWFHLDVRTVGDLGNIQAALPSFLIPDVPFTLETVQIILPYSFALALVGILESLLTARLLDEMTETPSNKNREVRGQGVANIVSGFFGGMAGCAMIGQSMINIKSGGRGRLSTFVAGAFLLFLILVLGDWVKQIPMGALVGVMIMVSISTFDWNSLWKIHKTPVGDAVVMIMTVAVVVVTHDLSQGVMAGVIASALRFGWKMASIRIKSSISEKGHKHYEVKGQLFFGSTTNFIEAFEYSNDPEHIVIDFSDSHVWDHSASLAIVKVQEKYAGLGKQAVVVGLNEESQQLIQQTEGLTSSH